MNEAKPLRLLLVVEEVLHEGGPAPAAPQLRGAALAVARNPFAGRYEPEIQAHMDLLRPIGLELADRLIAALGGLGRIEGYGKGAIVGEAGELEHAALWHAPGGYAMRDRLGGAKAIVPSTKKVGGVGARLDVPVTHINASYVRSHFDSVEVGIPDGPRADEIVYALVMTTGARVHARAGGAGGEGREGGGRTAMTARIRKLVTFLDETREEMGRAIDPPIRRAAAVAVIANPFAGRYVEDLEELMAVGAELGGLLGERAVAALGVRPEAAESYGKAALVGEGGELEHAAAILHPRLGAPLRKAVGGGAALVPSSKKMGGPGQPLDVPLGHKDAAYVRSHFDGMEVRVNDAPRAGEILVAVAVTARRAAIAEGGRAEGRRDRRQGRPALSAPRTAAGTAPAAVRPTGLVSQRGIRRIIST